MNANPQLAVNRAYANFRSNNRTPGSPLTTFVANNLKIFALAAPAGVDEYSVRRQAVKRNLDQILGYPYMVAKKPMESMAAAVDTVESSPSKPQSKAPAQSARREAIKRKCDESSVTGGATKRKCYHRAGCGHRRIADTTSNIGHRSVLRSSASPR